ncbi:hypothetical protein [Thalassoglobus sp.]|uniref:hypothetical protein n=1 Tax=Thalassoglobus sp. TaxID=2795869 RepID=UPI003AA847BF
MSLKSLISGDVSNVFMNTSEFAETITRFPHNVGAGVQVTAIIAIEDGETDEEAGKAHVHIGTALVEDSVIVKVRDRFTIRGDSVQVTKVKKTTAGMIKFWWKRVEHESRTVGFGGVL